MTHAVSNVNKELEMAEFEKEEFKFPDEIEAEAKNEAENDEIEVEIEDDTPEKDKNREPLPKKVAEDLYNDELEDYSAKVKGKLVALKRLAHDERREKERVLRENQEATALAKRLFEENKRLKTSLNDTEKVTHSAISEAIQSKLKQAKDAHLAAYESGESERILETNLEVNRLANEYERVKNYRPTPLQEEEFHVPIEQQTPKVDPTAVRWQKQNQWFGQDKVMTGMALAVHEALKDEGIVVASDEYYKRIDQTMRQRFPEKFPKAPSKSSIVAPATRSTSSKRIVLTTSQQNIAKKLGLKNEQYAREVLKLES
jgi:hypothetical protein